MNLANEFCPICHRPAQLTTAGRYRHNTPTEDRLCRIQLEMINLKLEERQLMKELTTAAARKSRGNEE